jgi:hypothetical protein
MGAPKSSAAFDPLWEEIFNIAFERPLTQWFDTEKEAKNFQRRGYYYRNAKRHEVAAAKKITEIINDGEGKKIETWLYRAEKIQITIRPYKNGWEVLFRNSLGTTESDKLKEMFERALQGNPLDPTPATKDFDMTEGAGKELTATEEEGSEGSESGIPDIYRTGQD